MTEIRVSGPVEVWSGGQRVDVGPSRRRLVLAALAADAGRPVPVDTLIDRVWGPAPPGGARRSLHVHITRLRQVLRAAPGPDAPAGIVFASGCYRLDADPARVDVHRSRLLAARAREPGRTDGQRAELLRQAVASWHGEPLAGLSGLWVEQCRQAWRQQHLDTVVAWARAELAVADPGAVVEVVSGLAGEHPLAEQVAEVLMRALAAAGRPAEALAHYETVRRRLADELGADPSGELQSVHRAILQGGQPPAPAAAGSPAPAQLPADLPGFAGRTEHLAQLDAVLATAPTAVVVIAALSGTAGVGKTALAVHWAHTVADRFPDGQLYVNLRGFDPAGRAMIPAEAVRGFLDAFGVLPERLPAGLDAQAALYRSLLTGRRVLILLDNARDAEQVRPLLPGTAGAMVLVTSRNQLTGLIAAERAHPLTLDVLSDGEARDLLVRRLGADRVHAEQHAVDAIVDACARLPLALAVTAARARQTRFPLAALAGELAESRHRLDALDTGDPAGQVRAVLSWSYTALTAPAQRLFRLLGLHPGPDVSTAAAAGLAGRPVAVTRRLLGELTRANLLVEHLPGRYAFHDLLRAYAVDLAATGESGADRRDAVVRLLDHYTHSAYGADRVLYPARDPIDVPLGTPAAGTSPEPLAEHRDAMRWLGTEYPVLIALVRHAADHGYDTHTWQLTWALDTYLIWRGHRLDRLAAWQAALDVADRLGDLVAQACAHRGIARADILLGRHEQARTRLGQALDLYVRADDGIGQANVHISVGYLWAREGDFAQALRHSRRALALYEAAGSVRGQGNALNQIGLSCVLLGEHTEAVPACRQAVALLRQAGDRIGEADAWDSLGFAYHHLGRHAEAVDCYERSLALSREFGAAYTELSTLTNLGDTHHAAGNAAAARDAWTAALNILDDLDHPDARRLRAKIDGLHAPGPADLPD